MAQNCSSVMPMLGWGPAMATTSSSSVIPPGAPSRRVLKMTRWRSTPRSIVQDDIAVAVTHDERLAGLDHGKRVDIAAERCGRDLVLDRVAFEGHGLVVDRAREHVAIVEVEALEERLPVGLLVHANAEAAAERARTRQRETHCGSGTVSEPVNDPSSTTAACADVTPSANNAAMHNPDTHPLRTFQEIGIATSGG